MGEDASAPMPLTLLRSALFFATALLGVPSARALIIYGTGPTDVNNALNTTAPASGAPWLNVVQFGVNNASGIYLGNGCILTANHVAPVPGSVTINGLLYTVDPDFAPLQITESPDVVDMKLVKILGIPDGLGNRVLPALPVVQKLPINFSTTADLSLNCTIIGWGVGKGTIIPNQGWNWGDNSTRAQRWGTNRPLSTAVSAVYDIYSYEALQTSFKRTSEITLGDSGSALFQQILGVWKLSGLTTSVLQYLKNAAQYDGVLDDPLNTNIPNPTLGDQPDAADFVRLEKYAHLLRYENWANLKLGSPTAVTTADTDKDGLPNLLEYAFHTDPGTASVSALPQVGMESGNLTLTYTQLLSATDLSYVVQESPSLSPPNWTSATVVEETVSTSGVTRVVKAKVALGAATQKYLRLSVTKVP